MEKIKVQLAIQGGGAKIVALMAALEALEELEDRIEVTKIVGTSAGAIAGAFFASGVGVKNIVAEWRGGSVNALLDQFVQPKRYPFIPAQMSLAWAMYRDKPIWDTQAVRTYLGNALSVGNPKMEIPTFSKLKSIKNVELYAITTHLMDRRAKESKLDDGLVEALLESAGLPYYFKKWDPTGANASIVDGGICDNLPAGRILGAANTSEVPVCITFEQVPDQVKPNDFGSFTKAIFDSAIEYSTEKSLSQFPNTLALRTTISTFDFRGALKALAIDVHGKSEYGLIREQAREFFSNLHGKLLERREQNAISESISLLHPWHTDNPTAKAMMRDLYTAIDSQFGGDSFIFHKVTYRATLDSLRDARYPDTLTYEIEFEPGEKDLYCYWMGVTDSNEGQLAKAPEMQVVSVHDEKFVPHVRMPVIKPDKDGDRFEAIFFNTPLKAGTRYRLTHSETGFNLLTHLRKTNGDELGFSSTRVLGAIKNAGLMIDIPNDLAFKCALKPRAALKVQNARTEVENFPGYRSYTFRAQNVEGVFALDFVVN